MIGKAVCEMPPKLIGSIRDQRDYPLSAYSFCVSPKGDYELDDLRVEAGVPSWEELIRCNLKRATSIGRENLMTGK